MTVETTIKKVKKAFKPTQKPNYVELKGNVAKLPTKTDKVTIITIGLLEPQWKREQAAKKEKELKTKFVSISCFDKTKSTVNGLDLKVGELVHVLGYLSVIEDKETKFTHLSVVATEVTKLTKKANTLASQKGD